jgi:hypothetical protein
VSAQIIALLTPVTTAGANPKRYVFEAGPESAAFLA